MTANHLHPRPHDYSSGSKANIGRELQLSPLKELCPPPPPLPQLQTTLPHFEPNSWLSSFFHVLFCVCVCSCPGPTALFIHRTPPCCCFFFQACSQSVFRLPCPLSPTSQLFHISSSSLNCLQLIL